MTCSSPDFAAPFSEVIFGSTFSLAGEMGIVSSGTGELDLIFVGGIEGADMAEVRMEKRRQ